MFGFTCSSSALEVRRVYEEGRFFLFLNFPFLSLQVLFLPFPFLSVISLFSFCMFPFLPCCTGCTLASFLSFPGLCSHVLFFLWSLFFTLPNKLWQNWPLLQKKFFLLACKQRADWLMSGFCYYIFRLCFR